jgi:hypothetical protein
MFSDDELASDDASFVRPFVVTQGRTVGEAGDTPLETLVVARTSPEGLAPDHAAVVTACSGDPVSVMEIAMHLDIQIGVARVLVADLTASEHVEQYDTASSSESSAIVKRLLEGLRAL